MLITVTWQPPIVTGGFILGYEYRIMSGSEQREFTVANSNLTFTVTGLSPFTNYIIEVRVVGMSGRGRIARLAVRTGELGMLCHYSHNL